MAMTVNGLIAQLQRHRGDLPVVVGFGFDSQIDPHPVIVVEEVDGRPAVVICDSAAGRGGSMDFAAYWITVLGDRTPAQVVDEFDLDGDSRPDLDEWLGVAEGEAARIGAVGLDGLHDYHRRAVDMLLDAAEAAE